MADKKGIPEKIKLGDKEYVVKDHPELLELMQTARKEEKDKLYSDIATKEAKIKTLEDEKTTLGELSTTKEAKLKELQDELAVAKAEKEKLEKETKGKGKSKDDDDDDDDEDDKGGKKGKGTKKSDAPTKEDFKEMLEEALKKQAEAHRLEIEKVQKGLNTKNVGDYRKEQLEKYKDVIIEDLVPESLDSVEAVNKAVATALEKSKQYIRKDYTIDGKSQKMTIAEYEEYEAKNKETKKGDEGAGGKEKTEDYESKKHPAKPGGGSGDLTGKELLARVDEMSQEEYEKNADKILAEAKSMKYEDTE